MLKPSGKQPQKANFFKEVASAFEILSIFYSLGEDEQQELLEHLITLKARSLNETT